MSLYRRQIKNFTGSVAYEYHDILLAQILQT